MSYEKVVIFGLPTAILLLPSLLFYNIKYLVDIRDHHRIAFFPFLQILIACSICVVLSSRGFLEWLPKKGNYLISHNIHTSFPTVERRNLDASDHHCKYHYRLSFIGTLRDYDVNVSLVEALKESVTIELHYYGDGPRMLDLEDYAKKCKIGNVYFHGRYKVSDEFSIYNESDIVNILLPYSDKNSRTLVPNRLYNAMICKKPVLCFSGTYLCSLVEKYELGVIINNFSNIENILETYLLSLDKQHFNNNVDEFLSEVKSDNDTLYRSLQVFIDK
jgi:glycosyltransferase involved in cell wall biosynthesis